jgi:hypothetical protein
VSLDQVVRPDDRTLATVASDGVAFLVHWLIILLLLGQAVVSVLRPPDDQVAVGVITGLVCLLWATFCLGMGLLRGTRPDGSDQPPPAWLGVLTTAGCLISLEVVRTIAGLSGPWPGELLVGGLFVAAVTVWRGPVAGGVTAVVMAVLALVLPGVTRGGSAPLRTSLAGVVPSVAILAAGFSVALALVALGRAARSLQRNLDVRDEVLVQEQAVRAATEVAAELERSLHDTALNTLETIAAHGDHLDPQVVAQRCRADHQRLSAWRHEADLVDLPDVLARLESHAARLGLSVESALVVDPGHRDGQGRGSAEGQVRGSAGGLPGVPAPVLSALAGAGAEALTNVAKHAGVSRATLLVRHDPDGVQMFVADEGVGAGRDPAGFGVARSILERMEAVGGQALTGSGPEDRGTVVLMQWIHPDPPDQEIGADLLSGTARIVLLMATFVAGTASALIVLGWLAYERPWLALVGAFAPVLVAASITERARSGARVGAGQVVAACATYLLVGALAVLADPYCSALLGEGVMLDARAPMMAVLLLLAPRARVVGAIVATVGVAHLATAVAWNRQWLLCGPDTAQAGIYVVAALGAAWIFVGRIDRLTNQLATARAAAMQAQVRINAELSIRAEEELWVADTLSSAQDLLQDIAEGRRSPADPGTRAACAAETQYLRALLAVGSAPSGLRRPARIWLRLLYAHGCALQVRGAFAGLDVPPDVVGHVGGVIDILCATAPGASVTLSGWAEPGPTIVLSAAGPSVEHAGAVLRERVARVAGDAWVDADPDRLDLEWSWSTTPMPVPAGASG